MDIVAREMQAEELARVIETRNNHFPPIAREDWYREGTMTAAVALLDDQIVGAIPLAIRRFQVAPGRVVTAAFENAVLVIDGIRDKGIGTKMIDAAKQFLADRCDVLMVYRGHERSKGYNFYEKTDHFDLHYIIEYILHQPLDWGDEASPNMTQDADTFLALEPQILNIYQSIFGRFGGFPVRQPGYWGRMLSGHIYAVHPTEFTYLWYQDAGRMIGYCILGRRTEHPNNRDYRPLQILELAALNNDYVAGLALLKAASTLASRQGCKLTMQGHNHPLEPLFRALGAKPASREDMSMIMGQLLNPAGFGKALEERPLLENIEIKVWTPKRDFVLKPAQNTATSSITLGMKEDTLTRLLLHRLDPIAAIADEPITISESNDTVVGEIAEAFAGHDWVYHALDYI
ncbi:MAG: GNAT family N-acetyltransferase [Firmicutes bacterium]|nr:GNAT family N-acetyltransferase [Bacillota bacterium]